MSCDEKSYDSDWSLYSFPSPSDSSMSLGDSPDEFKDHVGSSSLNSKPSAEGDDQAAEHDGGMAVDPDTSSDDEWANEFGMISKEDEDADGHAGVTGARGWRPGQDVGERVGRSAPLSAQSQVLLANVICALRSLPKPALQDLSKALHVRDRDSLVLGIGAKLFCLSARSIGRTLESLESSSFPLAFAWNALKSNEFLLVFLWNSLKTMDFL